ncbi:MAG: mechanosensitive ion channel [Vicinamibacterales bacterium]
MTHSAAHVLWGGAFIVVALALAGIVRHRMVRRRLLFSTAVVGVYLAWHGALVYLAPADPAAPPPIPHGLAVENLLLAFAIVTAGITLLFNPLFEDRMPDKAPAIVQDAMIVSLLGLIAVFGIGEEAWITSTAVAALVGFALQEQLANAFAGLAIQVEKPFRVGQWIVVGEHEGRVTEVTWRATKIVTKAGNLVILPNNLIARDAIRNFSEPAAPTRLYVDVGASYLVPPNEVKAALLAAMAQVPQILPRPSADVVFRDFGDSALIYRARFWIDDFAVDEPVRHAVRTAIYYEFHRRDIEIPWPIRVLYNRKDAVRDSPEIREGYFRDVSSVPVLAALPPEALHELAAVARPHLFADGEVIVREGDPGGSMYLVRRGRVAIVVGPDRHEVAITEAGGYFGEMSLLTGDPRSATVLARGDCEVLEIEADAFAAHVRRSPEIVDEIAHRAEARRRELDASRTETETPAAARLSLARRMRNFFRI